MCSEELIWDFSVTIFPTINNKNYIWNIKTVIMKTTPVTSRVLT